MKSWNPCKRKEFISKLKAKENGRYLTLCLYNKSINSLKSLLGKGEVEACPLARFTLCPYFAAVAVDNP